MPLSGNATTLAAGVKRREVWGWMMYDFANSGYTTVVITALFNAYFVGVVARGQPAATLAWTLALALSYLFVIVTAPAVGAYADAHGAKKKLLAITTVGCVLSTAALYWAGPGDVTLAVVFIVLSNFFYGSGENLIAAFLPELATSTALGKLSGWGWSFGYLGGLTSLGVALLYVNHAQATGASAAEFVPVTMLLTALLFALTSLPTFLFLRERPTPQPVGSEVAMQSWRRFIETLHYARRYKDFMRFLLCGACYQAGISTVIALAAIYAEQVMHFVTQQTLLLVMVVNITAAVGALAFGYVQDRIGHGATLSITLVGWIVMTLLAYLSEGHTMFWIAANLAGLCMGSSQSAGRAMVGVFAPPDRRAEFYGLWGVATKFSAIVGPLSYGVVTWLSNGDHRLAILISGLSFVIGLMILAGVDIERGKVAAQSYT
ncbi:MAG: MFS transporter [Burkholderiales bacterium]